jgi:hypothetical protein
MRLGKFFLVTAGFSFCGINLLFSDEPLKAKDHREGFLLIGPFSLGDLFKQSEKARDLFPELAFADIIEALNECKVSILQKREMGKFGKSFLVVEGRLSFKLKDKAGQPFKINLLEMKSNTGERDYCQNPPTCKTTLNFGLEATDSKTWSVRWFLPPRCHYDLSGKILGGPKPRRTLKHLDSTSNRVQE